MTDIHSDGLRARISRQSEEALGRFAQELLESPVVSGVLSRAMDAREKAAQAQELAMGALNLPSAGDLERLTRRVRSVSQRLEGVEDALDRLEERLGASAGATLDRRLGEIETQLASLATQLARLGDQLTPTATQPVTTATARKPTATRTRAAAAKKRAAAKQRSS